MVLDVRTTYRKTKKPLVLGQLRMHSWRPLISIPTSGMVTDADVDGEERKRVADYWLRQRELYGFEFGEIMIQVDFDERGPIVTSSTRVMRVLPGDRVDMGPAQ